MASNKEASVASSLERLGLEERRSWDVHFFRSPNDWEMGGVDDFLRTLDSNLPPTGNGDRMRWKLSKNGDFNVRSFYNKLRRPLPIIFPWKGVWKVKAPRRVSFFVWTVVWNKILTDTLLGWWNWPGKLSSRIWNLAPLCLMWCLWKERNGRTFEDMESSDDQLLASFSGTLFDWSRAWGLTSSDSLPLFLISLLL
ncbi:hypothetical protein SO802_008459 [Lithocarpus litseifolius]|uniref:Reverse transcriptase zinc-binding domain-containing protein n=1 Tax=Lithocarpus litseifolius TaxID=425828 RepID=A0AAW2D988_9ROSI